MPNVGIPLYPFLRKSEYKLRRFLFSRNYRLLPISELFANNDKYEIFTPEKWSIENAYFFGSKEKIDEIINSDEFVSPKMFFGTVEDVEVMGWTDFVFRNDIAYYPDAANPADDMFVAELEGRARLSRSKAKINIHGRSEPIHSKRAVSLLAQSSTNYAHWVTEALPRLMLLKEKIDTKEWDVIIDYDLHQNHLSAFASLGVEFNKIIFVKSWQRVKVKELLYVSSPAYTPADSRIRFQTGAFPQPQNRTTFCPPLLRGLSSLFRERTSRFDEPARVREIIRRQEILGRRQEWSSSSHIARGRQMSGQISGVEGRSLNPDRRGGANPRRLFLMRPSDSHNGRQCENFSALIPILDEYGFCKVHISSLTFDEQVALMQNAECIISPIGATLANLVFAPPRTSAVILAPIYKNADFSYFRHLMSALDHKVAFVLGEQIPSPNRTQLTRNYKIEPACLRDALAKLLEN
jgi:hypothetical protein